MALVGAATVVIVLAPGGYLTSLESVVAGWFTPTMQGAPDPSQAMPPMIMAARATDGR
jgi:hypothetical protein